MIVQWLDGNTLVQSSLGSMTPSVWGDVGALPWVSLEGGTPSAAARNLELRITIAGEPGACASPTLASSGLARGAWTLTSSAGAAACSASGGGGSGASGGGTTTTSQLLLACPACQLTAETTLTLTFPFSCQSMLLEAGGVPPFPRAPLARSALLAPPALTAGAPGALLAGVTWTVTPVLSVLWDNITSSGALGWRLVDQKLTFSPPLATTAVQGSSSSSGSSGGSALALQPAPSAVVLTIALPLSPTYATTLLTPQVPWTQLLANIVGLSGVLGVFGMAFGQWEALFAGRPSAAAAQGGGGVGGVCGVCGGVEGGGAGAAAAATKLTGLRPAVAGSGGASGAHLVANPLARSPAAATGAAQPAHSHGGALASTGAHAPLAGPLGISSGGGAGSSEAGRQWRMMRDGSDVWFVSCVTGESAWELPAGAVLAPQ
jgi:hypothetical protein